MRRKKKASAVVCLTAMEWRLSEIKHFDENLEMTRKMALRLNRRR